jgi:hypothetical protein
LGCNQGGYHLLGTQIGSEKHGEEIGKMIGQAVGMSVVSRASHQKRFQSFHHLELGHVHSSKRIVLFAQFWPVFLEVKTQSGVKDQILSIYVLGLVPNNVDQKILAALP